MNPEMGAMPPEMPAEGKPEGAPTDILSELQKALMQTNEAIQGSSLPKEAQVHISNAVSEYTAGMKIIGDAMGVSMPGDEMPLGNQPADVGGRKGAVPADQPMGKGIRAVPA